MTKDFELQEFELNRISQSKFIVASFERRIYPRHLNQIRVAIQAGRMHDTIITVIPEGNRFRILDGQHRFSAMMTLLKTKEFDSIPIYLRIMKKVKGEENGRDVYLALDSGKPLTIRDILKVYDDGKQPFFNKLRMSCNHYGSKENLTFAGVLAAYHYAVSGDPFFTRDHVKDAIGNMTEDDVHRLAYVITNMYTVLGRPREQFIYKAICFRNIVKVIWTRPELITKQGKFQSFLKKLATDSFLQTNSTERAIEAYKVVGNYMLGKLGETR